MLQHIQAFFSAVAAGKIEIYNEFSLQHELGLFLRSCRTVKKIQFERNVSFFSFARDRFIKKEIDISLFATAERPISAIELKFPSSLSALTIAERREDEARGENRARFAVDANISRSPSAESDIPSG
jgi:hypothetical protein